METITKSKSTQTNDTSPKSNVKPSGIPLFKPDDKPPQTNDKPSKTNDKKVDSKTSTLNKSSKSAVVTPIKVIQSDLHAKFTPLHKVDSVSSVLIPIKNAADGKNEVRYSVTDLVKPLNLSGKLNYKLNVLRFKFAMCKVLGNVYFDNLITLTKNKQHNVFNVKNTPSTDANGDKVTHIKHGDIFKLTSMKTALQSKSHLFFKVSGGSVVHAIKLTELKNTEWDVIEIN